MKKELKLRVGFLYASGEIGILNGGSVFCSILPGGCNDGADHILYCLEELAKDGLLEEGTTLEWVGSVNRPMDIDQLEYEGACMGLQTITARREGGEVVETTREVPYY